MKKLFIIFIFMFGCVDGASDDECDFWAYGEARESFYMVASGPCDNECVTDAEIDFCCTVVDVGCVDWQDHFGAYMGNNPCTHLVLRDCIGFPY